MNKNYKGFYDDDKGYRKVYCYADLEDVIGSDTAGGKPLVTNKPTAGASGNWDEVISTGVGVLNTLFKPKTKTGVEAVCGKKPKGILGIKGKKKKEKIAAWEKCAANYSAPTTPKQNTQYTPTPNEKKGIGTLAWVGIGVVSIAVLSGIGFLIVSKMNKAKVATVAVSQ